ncbi:hypothetical protein [Streptomyces harbinensis]|uniref:hypothetical protein n=1 Tax=Streptomyces harbinensis TaxID=1176198 RepID=UPI003679D521
MSACPILAAACALPTVLAGRLPAPVPPVPGQDPIPDGDGEPDGPVEQLALWDAA